MVDYARYAFQLDECLDWILNNSFRRVILQLKRNDLKYSVPIQTYLKKEHDRRLRLKDLGSADVYELDIYISQPNCCCVDLIVNQHVSNVDAMVHFGRVCLSEPHVNNQWNKPILFVFKQPTSEDLKSSVESISSNVTDLFKSENNLRVIVFYDTNFVEQAIHLQRYFLENPKIIPDHSSIEFADLYCSNDLWYTTPTHNKKFVRQQVSDESQTRSSIFEHYALRNTIDHYNCSIYIGSRPSLSLFLNGPSKLYRVKCEDSNYELEKMNVQRMLNRRIALVDRLKDDEELRIGVILTNPLPQLNTLIQRMEAYAKNKRHTLYFITMVQIIDECKIGNFDLCDAFVIVNSCACSTVLESLVFNRPILTELEFKLACGFEAEYGRVLWPGSTSEMSLEDICNKRKVSDVSLALIHTRNELLERCSQARTNKWSGMDYGASKCNVENDNIDSINEDGSDSVVNVKGDDGLTIEDGLKGIASSYISEPSVSARSMDDSDQQPQTSGK